MDYNIENQDFIPNYYKQNLITMIARLDEEKNVLEFLEIIKESALSQDWQVQIVGDGDQRKILQNYINDNALSNVSLLGQLNSEQVKRFFPNPKSVASLL